MYINKSIFKISKLLSLHGVSEHVSRDLNLSPCVTPSLFPFLLFILGTEFFRSVKPYLSPIFVTWIIFVDSGQLVWKFLFWAKCYTNFQKRLFLFLNGYLQKRKRSTYPLKNHVIRVCTLRVQIVIAKKI